MRKIGFLLPLIILLFVTATQAQRRDGSQQRPSRSTSSLAQSLWYGGGFNLGFSGNGRTNLFQFGLSPMVGYKIFEEFSIGPRFALQYNYYKSQTLNGGTDSAQPFSWSIGAFTRYKIIPTIFAQVEFEFENEPDIYIDFDRINVVRREQNNFYIGGGYTSSRGLGTWGYELVLLFNLNQSNSTIDLPYVLRIGVTYNF